MTRLLATAYLLFGALSALDGYTLGGLDATAAGPQVAAECHVEAVTRGMVWSFAPSHVPLPEPQTCRDCHFRQRTEREWAGSRVNRSGGRQREGR